MDILPTLGEGCLNIGNTLATHWHAYVGPMLFQCWAKQEGHLPLMDQHWP